MTFLLIWTAVPFIALWLYFRSVYSRFSNYGVKHFCIIPPLGNMLPVMLRKEHVAYNLDKMYKTFPSERFIGRYEFINPAVIIRDLDLIKKITIKDFEHFIDHRNFTDEHLDPLFGRNLFSLRGSEWKDMRSFLSPTFTSSKIRHMVPFIEEVGKQMVEALNDEIKKSQSTQIDIDSKDLTTRSTNDVIASCAFGFKTNSYKDPNNIFYTMGKLTTTFNLKKFILFFTYAAFPSLCKFLNLTLLSKETQHFFENLVLNTMKKREAENIIRPDMIHLLMEAKKGILKNDEDNVGAIVKDAGFATVNESNMGNKQNLQRVWSEIDLVAQAAIFLVAGFETVSAALTFTLYELAMHPDVQDKLAKEIKEFDARHGGNINYSLVSSLNYLDMVISEVLRLWPPLTVLDRLCVKSFNIGKPNENSSTDFIVRKGEIVIIPVWSLHHDPKFYPDPEKFDPERFSEHNKHLINPLTYMPFGIGPRNCIASRFALCELKVLLYHIIKDMELSPSARTLHPAKLSAESFNPRFKGGHWLRVRNRC